ncbi:MAG: TIGR03067 domain-containing protein [Isosphaeraceae bacterium]
MFTILVSLMFAQLGTTANQPTDTRVAKAHQLLNGEWEVVSYTDDGETLGAALVRAKLAKDGRVRVASRSFQIVNPDTNETRVVPFRLNPVPTPRQIIVTTRDDRTIGGIYRFDGDQLIVCLETSPDAGYPSSFESQPGSNRTLITFKMVAPNAATEVPAPLDLGALKPPTDAVVTPAELAVLATATASRKPTESELRRVRELFAGNWQIRSIIDDGERLGAELIHRGFAEDGQVRFGSRTFSIVNPRTTERKINTYRLDPTRTPSEIDVSTQFDSILKGIYRFHGDTLTVCLTKNDDGPRPDAFEAPGGSRRMLIEMQLADDEAPADTRSQPDPEPMPSADQKAREFDARVRRSLEGSWVLTDSRGTLTTVFQPGGLFVATRTWGRGSKRLFGPPSDSSSGTWSYRSGLLSAYVSSTTDRQIVGHQVNSRVKTIGEDTMTITDVYGTVKTLRRLR